MVRALESNAAIADLNNGVKPGQSVMIDSAQYSADIRRFRRMAFGSQDNASDFSEAASEYETTLSSHSIEFRKSGFHQSWINSPTPPELLTRGC